jgi:hypothetical protein
MENTSATTAGNDGLIKAARVTRALLKGLSGAIAVAIGATLVTSGVVLPMLFGGLVLYTGGRQLFETGKELLPLKAQSVISTLFTGKELTEITPVKQPKTALGKAFRVLEYVNLAFTGAGAFAAGGFAMGMGSQEPAMAQLVLGGLGLMAAGSVNIVDQAVSGIRALLGHARAKAATAPDVTRPVLAPEAAPAPTLTAKPSTPAFNQTATPAATPDSAPAAEAPKPAAPQPPTV